MRGTDSSYSAAMEKNVCKMILNMWNRLLKKCAEKNTSIGAIASNAGVNASSVYHSLNKARNDKMNYVDNPISSIFAISEELGIDIDEAIMGESTNPKFSQRESELNTILKSMPLDKIEELRLNMICYLKD